jgi:hypothetical protein
MVSNLFACCLLEIFHRKFAQFLDVWVVDDEIIEVHNKKVDNFIVFEIVPTHLIESELSLEDIVAEIKDNEALIDYFNDVVAFLIWEA